MGFAIVIDHICDTNIFVKSTTKQAFSDKLFIARFKSVTTTVAVTAGAHPTPVVDEVILASSGPTVMDHRVVATHGRATIGAVRTITSHVRPHTCLRTLLLLRACLPVWKVKQ